MPSMPNTGRLHLLSNCFGKSYAQSHTIILVQYSAAVVHYRKLM